MLKGFDELDIQDYQYSNSLGVNAKILVQLLKAVILLENHDCSPKYSETDAFVDFLLRSFGLDKYPSMIKLQYSIDFESDFKEIESTCSFLIQNPDIAQVLVVETDKHVNITSKADMNGQYQVIAEMIATAQEAFSLHRSESWYMVSRWLTPYLPFTKPSLARPTCTNSLELLHRPQFISSSRV